MVHAGLRLAFAAQFFGIDLVEVIRQRRDGVEFGLALERDQRLPVLRRLPPVPVIPPRVDVKHLFMSLDIEHNTTPATNYHTTPRPVNCFFQHVRKVSSTCPVNVLPASCRIEGKRRIIKAWTNC